MFRKVAKPKSRRFVVGSEPSYIVIRELDEAVPLENLSPAIELVSEKTTHAGR